MAIRLAQLAIVAAAVGIWELVVQTGLISSRILAAPSSAAVAMGVIFSDSAIGSAMATTLWEVVLAIVIAIPIGAILGFIVAEQPAVNRALAPVLYVGTAIPKSLFLPLFILALGIGINQKVVFGVVQAFFVVAVSTMVAVRGVPVGLTLLGRSLKATSWQMYLLIYLPYMLPVIVQGVRIGVIYAATGILFAEMYASRGGLGRLINIWGSSYDLPKLLAGAVLASLSAVAINSGLRLCEDRVGRWRTVGR